MIEAKKIINLTQSIPLKGFIPDGGTRHATIQTNSLLADAVDFSYNKKYMHLTTRQVPTCLALTGLGCRIKSTDVPILKEMAFPLRQLTASGHWIDVPTHEPLASGVSSAQVSFLGSLLNRYAEDPYHDSDETSESDDQSLYSEDTDSCETDPELLSKYRFQYNDPFLVNSVIYAKKSSGQSSPDVLCWPGGMKTLQDGVPAMALGPDWEGNPRRTIPFYKIATAEVKIYVLLNHTHWGKHLVRLVTGNTPVKGWALSLLRRIKAFIRGFPDPRWRTGYKEYLAGESYTTRPGRDRALRFLQMLKTIDGMFIQVYLCDITAGWNWRLYDNFVLRNMYLLLDDEFLDGTLLTSEPMTHYETLKRFRGALKAASLKGEELPQPDNAITQVFKGVVQVLNNAPDSDEKLQKLAIITQTRGCGTPPPIVVLKSKEKFLRSVSEVETFSNEKAQLCRLLVNKAIQSMPDHYFTGLSTKASVRVTASACYEKSRKEGGTAERIRELVCEGTCGRRVRILDLNTGKTIGYKLLSDITHGEYIFWRCLEEVLSTDPVELRKAKLVMIKEPGKARTVTKASAALKIVLDLVNGICSYPLKKVKSSTSGMGKSHHGWNFFKELYSSWKEIAFKPNDVRFVQKEGSPNYTKTTTFEHLFVSCTDYSEATDRMLHKRYAAPISDLWMRKCGIPKLLRGIIHETCFKPREILFSATGVLKSIGDPTDEENIRRVWLERGVLMGDPLTKVLLHLLNIGVRESGYLGTDKSVLNTQPGLQRFRSLFQACYREV